MKKLLIISVLTLIITLIQSTFTIAQTNEVGTLPGAVSVSPSGAATYTIPIDLPVGRAGMTPSLALTYNSKGGNGLLGMRWSLSGLSSISRTGTTIYHDGEIDGVDFDDNDQFILDGKRLIAVNLQETEFRTELETYSKIIAHGTAGNGPQWFEVYTKSGIIMEYGYTSDSRIEASGRTDVLFWHLNRISDRKGNYIDFVYEELFGMGKIKKISYTGNHQTGNGTFYDIVFEYDNRMDVNEYFVSGSSINQVDILESIRIKYKDGTILKEYDLKYDETGIYSHLEEIELSDTEGKKLNPTTFEWGASTQDFEFEFTGISNNGDNEVDYTFGDFNGDGKTDVVCTYYENGDVDHFSVFYSNGDGTTFTEVQDVSLNRCTNSYLYFLTGDFDGNGLEDLAMIGTTHFRIFKSVITENDHEFGSASSITAFTFQSKHYFHNIDINGNGKDDLILIGYNFPTSNSGDYLTAITAWGYDENNYLMEELINMNGLVDYYFFYHSETDLLPIFPGDFNGDGKTDLLVNKSANESDIMTYDVSSKQLVKLNPQVLHYPTKYHKQVRPGDYNGDGITDLLTGFGSAGVWQLRYFNGSDSWVEGECPIIEPESGSWHEYFDNFKTMASDFNGDGKIDILQFYEEYYDPGYGGELQFVQSHYIAHYSNGLNFTTESTTTTSHNAMLERPYPYNDFDGDGKNDCFIDDKTENNYNRIIFFHKNEQKQLVQKITNGFGANTEIEYLPLTNNLVYTKRTDADYPLVDIQPASQVVAILKTDNGYNGYFTMNYSYEGAIVHKLGKGYLGFQKLHVGNDQTHTYTISNFKLFDEGGLYYHPYLENSETWWTSKFFVYKINNLVNNFDVLPNDYNEKIYTPVVTQSLEHSWDIDEANTFIKTVKIKQDRNDIDDYGNSIKSTVLIDPANLDENVPDSQYDHQVISETNFADNINASDWLIGRPDLITNTAIYEDKPPDISATEYDYYELNESGNNGIISWPLVKSVITTPNENILFKNKLQYEYDVFGNIVLETLSAPNANPAVEQRVVGYDYQISNGYDGRFLTRIGRFVNYAPYYKCLEYDVVKGELLSSKDPAQLETTFEYDGFGKLINTNFPDGTNLSTMYVMAEQTSWWDNLAPINATFCTYSQLSGSSPVYRFYDKLQRELRQITNGLEENDLLYVDKSYYEDDGRLESVSDPYCSNEIPQYYTTNKYDDIGRVILRTSPVNSNSINYQGRTSTTTNIATGVTVINSVNAIGKLQTVTDPSGTITYNYFSSGNIESINALGSVTTMQYDDAGNQTSLDEPNIGTTVYEYNAYGELIEQTDARQNKYKMEYDVFGRLNSKTLINTDERTTYHYNDFEHPPIGNGFGKIGSISGPNNISYNYNYDEYNRIESKTELVEGVNYTEHFSYNADGKPETYTYPSGFSVTYGYSTTGHLKTITENENNEIIWEALTTNCRGQLTDYVLGNDLVTHRGFDSFGYPESISTGNVQDLEYEFNPATGNLNWRKDNLINLTENFTYDDMTHSRLTNWQVEGCNNYTVSHAANGNIIKKSDVTSIESHGSYQYGENAGKHAVTGIVNPTMQYLSSAQPQNISYTAFNKVEYMSQIKEGSIISKINDIYGVTFTYGPDNARKKAWYTKNKGILKTKFYIGSNYEIEIDALGNKRKIHYICGGDGLFAIYEMNDNGINNMYYIHKDYLGSYETITDSEGSIVEKLSFDPWGRRRNSTDWSLTDISTTFLFDRGYTGHEHLDNFDMINMNGRVYDPWLGRFLSPDPFVQAPSYSQNYNRYSYAFNNPLKYIDPSGYNTGPYEESGTGFRMGGRGGIYYSNGFTSCSTLGIGQASFARMDAHYINDKIYNLSKEIENNSVTFTGQQARNIFACMKEGFNIYMVQAFGNNTLVMSLGDIGEINIAQNGGINFSNNNAGAYISEKEIFSNGFSDGGDITLTNEEIRANAQKYYNSFDHSFIASMKRFFRYGKQNSNTKSHYSFYRGLGQGGGSGFIPHEGFFHLCDFLNNHYNHIPDTNNTITVNEWLWRYTHPFSNPDKYPGPENWK